MTEFDPPGLHLQVRFQQAFIILGMLKKSLYIKFHQSKLCTQALLFTIRMKTSTSALQRNSPFSKSPKDDQDLTKKSFTNINNIHYSASLYVSFPDGALENNFIMPRAGPGVKLADLPGPAWQIWKFVVIFSNCMWYSYKCVVTKF